MLKKYTLLISIGYSVSLLALSLMTLDFDKIQDFAPTFGDKIFHFVAYGLLTWTWFYTFHIKYKYSKLKALILVSIASIIFGTIIEVLQKELTNTRFFDWYDITANIGGVLIIASIVLFNKKSDVKYY